MTTSTPAVVQAPARSAVPDRARKLRKRLSNPWASLAAIVIAVLWTVPTVGLLVTSFNLIPAGQLDGGHIAYALLGQRTRYLNWAMIGILLVMGFVWQGWFLWAFLVFLFSRARVSPMDDVSPLSPVAIAVAISLLVLFVLTFTPIPLRIVA